MPTTIIYASDSNHYYYPNTSLYKNDEDNEKEGQPYFDEKEYNA